MSMIKDALEGMASILRESGYEVTLKESETEKPDIKKHYIKNKFNKIRDIDLKSIEYDTCVFLKEDAVNYFKMHDYIVASSDVTIGYIDSIDDVDPIIKTSRSDKYYNSIVERIRNYDYVIKLSDVFELMDSNEEFNA